MNSIDIINIRQNLGLSQAKFAELIGVDRRTVINYEQGKKIPESKIKLLDLLLKNENSSSNAQPIYDSKGHNNSSSDENLNREILDLKDHIKTLKNFIEEKTTVAEFYKAENKRLKEEIEAFKNV